MNARFYSPYIYRFLSADTIIPEPGDSQAYNRYTYVSNNPIISTDPSGHCEYNSNAEDPSQIKEGEDAACWEYLDTVIGMCPQCAGIGWEQNTALTLMNLINMLSAGWLPNSAVGSQSTLYAIAIVGQIEAGAGGNGSAALELVYNLHSENITLFVSLGFGGTVGANLTTQGTGELIFGIGDNNLAYKVAFIYLEVGAAAGSGIHAGVAVSSLDLEKSASLYGGVSGAPLLM